MEATEVQNVCRLCPETGANQPLLNVFDQKLAEENNMKDVILITTGIEVSETDLVSRKICERCFNITLKMLQFRQDALKQDKSLKAKCKIFLVQNGFEVPNGLVEVKDEPENEPTESESSANESEIHQSIQQLYTKYPGLKLSKSFMQQNIAPIISIPATEVKKYFEVRGLNMNSFIYKPVKKTVLPIKISKSEKEKYKCSPMLKRKLSMSGSDPSLPKVSREVAPEEESNKSSNNIESNVNLTTVKSKTLLECHVCRTFHNTSFALKIHLSKHKKCQFCKKPFKSLAAKDEHLKNSCEFQRILTSQPFVSLEPIHLNPGIRSNYAQSFEGFPSLPSKDKSNEVNMLVGEEEQINLSVATSSNSVAISPCSVSIVKPDIDIRNSSVPCNITGINDEQFLKEVIGRIKKNTKGEKTFTETMVQTNLPSNMNIKTYPTFGGGEFKGLKTQLMDFKIPINISKGPFHIQYEYSKPKKNKLRKINNNFDSLPVKYSRKNRNKNKTVTDHKNIVKKVSTPAKPTTETRPPTVLNSQVSKAIQLAIAPKPTPQTNSTSATPLLQSYASSIPQPTPVLGLQDFQRKFLNTALQNRNGKQVVTTVSKAAPSLTLPKPINVMNQNTWQLINGILRMPSPASNRTITTLNSAVVPNRMPGNSLGNTTIRFVPISCNKAPQPGVNVHNQSSNVLHQNGTNVTFETLHPGFHVVSKPNLSEGTRNIVGKQSVQQLVVPSVAPTNGSTVNGNGVATSVSYSNQSSSDASIQSKPVFRVKNIRELQ